VVHNFKKDGQKGVFEAIYKGLAQGGKMIIMEKLYPDDPDEAKKIFDHQMWRYDQYLPEDVAKEIIEHETLDFSPEYIMKEGETVKSLEKIGFKNIKVIDRIEQVVVLVAEK
jgi:ubiquinone/menaquinone biosynthesis C-methylase UbiE